MPVDWRVVPLQRDHDRTRFGLWLPLPALRKVFESVSARRS
jgi:hypothetical protein